jgi:metallo-beta-lactamase class B
MFTRLVVLGVLAGAPLLLRAQSSNAAPAAPADLAVTPCEDCAKWNEPQRPFRIHGNTWYVGTRELSAILVTSSAGHVLIDGGLSESAPLIAASIRSLGFRLEDVKLILNSHVHYDHAGGIAALQRASGAAVVVHPWSAAVLRTGKALAGDPQLDIALPIAPVASVREIDFRAPLLVGPLELTPLHTGGHTPGGTTWTWRSCEGARCWDVVYADSQTPISADGFQFTNSTAYPTALADFEAGHARIERLPCNLLLTPHPAAASLFERVSKRDAGDADALRDDSACRAYAATARQRLAERLSRERRNR